MMRKVVFDTNVLVSALWSPGGKPSQIITQIANGFIVPCYDYQIMLEYQDVLSRPKLNFSKGKTDAVLSDIKDRGIYAIAPKSSIVLPDETDRKFYDVAKASEAILITGNIRHYPKEPFIMTPAEFLELNDNTPV